MHRLGEVISTSSAIGPSSWPAWARNFRLGHDDFDRGSVLALCPVILITVHLTLHSFRRSTSPCLWPHWHPTIHQTGANSVARRDEFPEAIQRDLPCPAPLRKIFRLTRRANQNYKPRHLVLKRGALAIVTNVGTGCGGRDSVGVRPKSQGGLVP